VLQPIDSLLEFRGEHAEAGQDKQHVSGNSERASHIDSLVRQHASSVRAHMSHLFEPDPTEKWAEESLTSGHFAAAIDVSNVNDDVVQTQSESAGNLDPIREWVPWDRALRAKGRLAALLISIIGSALLALIASTVTWHNVAAAGSGIPQVKASASGFALPKHFHPHTLLAKMSGLSLCVSSGLAVGKEGPMIHIGACWGSILAGPISRIGGLGAVTDTELICVGAAAGVSAAFGAPLAGVLFAVEELGTSMAGGLRYSTMICAFGAAVTASLALKWLDLTRTQRLTLFEIDYKQTWAHWEAVWFCLLGMIGGVLGGAFIIANRAVHRHRLKGLASKDRFCWFLPSRVDRVLQYVLRLPPGSDSRVFEVVLLAIFTCISNFPRTLTRIPQNDGIFALFSQCHADPADVALGGHAIHDPIGLCSTQNTPNYGIVLLLLGGAALRFCQTTITFGALVPAGLFVPSLFIGGCVGRCMGVLLKFAGLDIEPGIYAMVGAGAVLAGVSRLTISLVVVLFELTGGLTYVVPFMVAVLSAKWVGDFITDGKSVYDVHAEMGGLAKVEQSEDTRLVNISVEDLCGSNDDVQGDGACAEAGIIGAAHVESPVLWTSGGLVRMGDLAAHCGVAAKGFVVLSIDCHGEVEVLGWADSERLLKFVECAELAGGSKIERWCRLSPPTASAPPRAVAPSALKPRGVVEDLSDLIDRSGVVRIRSDCPILTALCITQSRPSVKAFVSITGPHYAARTVSREHFLERLVSGRVRPHIA
jgi:H+/Cl- antiporter ClcA